MAMAAISHDSSKLPVDWELLVPTGPALTNHVGSIVSNCLYVHGGITKYGSTAPSDKLHCLKLSTMTWSEVKQPGSPALSHHACVVLENRYMLLIGGWNGRQRVSSLYAFDCQERKWLFLQDKGFPDGAGLSSHAASVLTTGEVLIVGREGSLRIQRKHGNVYILTGSVLKTEFTYRKMTNNTSSRSGHTINTVGNMMYIIGGRDDQLVEFHKGYSSGEPVGDFKSKFAVLTHLFKPLSKAPSGRKNHISITGKGCFIIHGGDTFDGRSREPVGEMFLVTTNPNLMYYKIGVSSVARSSHVCVSSGNRVIIHGGVAGKTNTVHGDSYELQFRKETESSTR